MNEFMGAPRWYALRTRSRHEKIVRDQLASQGIEPLLPTVKRLSQWKDRKKEIEVPLFSGYCFVRFAVDHKLPLLKLMRTMWHQSSPLLPGCKYNVSLPPYRGGLASRIATSRSFVQ